MNQRARAFRPAPPAVARQAARPALHVPSIKAMRAEDIRALQAAAGNRASRAAAQRTMNVGAAGDTYEREADAVAREVLAQSDGAQRAAVEEEEALQAKHVHREAEEEELQMKRLQRAESAEVEEEELQAKHVHREAEEEELQAKHVDRQAEEEEALQARHLQRDTAPEVGMEGGSVSRDTDTAIEGARGGGQPLSDGIRREMEGAFGTDFSGVRVHQGAEAADLNQRLSARAFTTGSDIFIGREGLNTGSRSGKELLAHELTHVVQQGAAGRNVRRRS